MNETAFKPFSEKTAQMIDAEVRNIIDSQYSRVKALLGEHKEKVEALSKALFAKETIGYPDLKEILGPRPYPISGAYEKFVDTRMLEEQAPQKAEELQTTEVPTQEPAPI
jgi:hypothetical protein